MTPGQQQASNDFFNVWNLVQAQWNVAVVQRYQSLQSIINVLGFLGG